MYNFSFVTRKTSDYLTISKTTLYNAEEIIHLDYMFKPYLKSCRQIFEGKGDIQMKPPVS